MEASAITHRLWQGSVPSPGEMLPFDLVVLCAEEHQMPSATFGARARVLRVPLTDLAKPLSPRRTHWAFRAAVEVARVYANGGRVLVTCAAGLNRSGLVNGLALLELGVDAPSAVAAIRRARPGALCNPFFEHLIYSAAGRSMVRIPVTVPA